MDETGNYLLDEFDKRVKLTEAQIQELKKNEIIEEEEESDGHQYNDKIS